MPTVAPTNNAAERPRHLVWLLLALLAVAILRLWRLPEAGPPDFDSVRNWQVVQELARGNFARLFIPGSPGFLVLYVPVAWLTSRFVVFQALNALLGLAGLGFFVGWVARQAALPGWQTAGLVMLGGTSLLLTFSGRDFTTSSAALLVATGLMRSHFARLRRPGPGAAMRVAAWLALGLCVTYKFLFLVPILGVLELVPADKLWRRQGVWGLVLLVLAAPYVVFGALGMLGGLPWWRWLAFYVRLVVPKAANTAGRQGILHFDVLYYFRYLATFESPLLLLGLVAALVLVVRQWQRGELRRGQPLALLPYLLVWAACLLAGMSLLIKAPRGLLLAYLPLAALAVLSGRQLLPRWGLMAALLAAVGLNIYRIQTQLYAPLPGPYPAVAAWLRQHGATRVASTVGNGLAPYLSHSQLLTVITDERGLAGLRRQGVQYVLLDGYWRVAGVGRFDSLRQQVPVAAWPAAPLQQPLLFLEHSEFTGLGFDETMAASRAAAADSLPLRLYRLR
jgi:hypothetical protein